MKKLQFLLILLVVGALFVPAVSAETIEELPYSDTKFQQVFHGFNGQITWKSASFTAKEAILLEFKHVENYDNIHYIKWVIDANYLNEDMTKCWYQRPSDSSWQPATMQVIKTRNLLGQVTQTTAYIYPINWAIGTESGKWISQLYQDDNGVKSSSPLIPPKDATRYATPVASSDDRQAHMYLTYASAGMPTQYSYIESYKNYRYSISLDSFSELSCKVNLQRVFDGVGNPSIIVIYNDSTTVFSDFSNVDTSTILPIASFDRIEVTTSGATWNYDLLLGFGEPDDPGETPTLRNGAVTMTDNNGTTITGFEVTAVNAYTGEEYTVVTDTDVAVMTLPMERTIQMRNPQTGVYEEAPVGYYRFYGQSSGYKMLVEDGIQVSVMPEKYGSYQICDIRVTSESGYLTGNHQFQIRSRSDNSILQTGTISAKSATTGEWFNTTVTEGIASLILPYDTSNVQSQYAGNYYVYATSPGYEDSDYGTQIVVMPHTVSEIHSIQLTPIGGIPTPGNVTLRIQAFSEAGPGVVNAEIFIAGVLGEGSSVWDTYTASSTGYLTVSVPGNSTYDIVASGAGYYDSARRVEVLTEDPPMIEIKLYLSGAPTLEPTTHPTGWPTDHPTTQPTGGIPDEDDDSEGFLMQAVRGIGLAFGVGFSTAKLIFGMLLALSIGYATAKQLRGGAAEFGLGLLGGTMLGVLIGLLPVWIIVVLLLIVGLYIGNRYVGGSNNG